MKYLKDMRVKLFIVRCVGIKITAVQNHAISIIYKDVYGDAVEDVLDGKTGKYRYNGECMVFPSKDQQDWNVWIANQKVNDKKVIDWEKFIEDVNNDLTLTCGIYETATLGEYHCDIETMIRNVYKGGRNNN